MTHFRITLLCAAAALASAQPAARHKRVLAWGDTLTAYQHDSISHALATMERLGRESGAYDMYIRTDSQWITAQPVPAPARNTQNLKDFDAIFFYGTGDNLSAQQKKDLLSFIHDEGKGFVGAHTGDDAFFDWPEFAEMIGGWFDNHPWGVFDAPVIVEMPGFPAMKGFPHSFTIRDEIYEHKNFSRDKVHVLASLDSSKLDYSKPEIHRKDHDFPVAWAKMYGKGRVFYCYLRPHRRGVGQSADPENVSGSVAVVAARNRRRFLGHQTPSFRRASRSFSGSLPSS